MTILTKSRSFWCIWRILWKCERSELVVDQPRQWLITHDVYEVSLHVWISVISNSSVGLVVTLWWRSESFIFIHSWLPVHVWCSVVHAHIVLAGRVPAASDYVCTTNSHISRVPADFTLKLWQVWTDNCLLINRSRPPCSTQNLVLLRNFSCPGIVPRPRISQLTCLKAISGCR